MFGFVGAGAVIGRTDFEGGDQGDILKTRADAPIQVAGLQVSGNHQRQAVQVAVIQNLEEFFLRPGRGVLGAQIIQHQQAHVANFFKALLKGGARVAVGKAHPVQQIGDGEEQGGRAQVDGLVGDGCSQVGFTAAIATFDDQPAGQGGSELLRLGAGSAQRLQVLV